MKTALIVIPVALLCSAAAVRAQVPSTGSRGQVRATASGPVALACNQGRYSENGVPLSANDSTCQPGLNGAGMAIAVGPAAYASTEEAVCPQGNTDRIVADLLNTSRGENSGRMALADFWSRLQQRAGTFGYDFRNLVSDTGATKGPTRCQLFILPVPVRLEQVVSVEFRSRQPPRRDDKCFSASTGQSAGRAAPLQPQAGRCSNSSSWQSAMSFGDSAGALVAGVFKNGSDRLTLTGQLWVWYR